MTMIDKARRIEPDGPATFSNLANAKLDREQDGWFETTDDATLDRMKARIAKYVLLIVAGIVLLFGCAVQFYLDWLEIVCPACFGR